MHSNQQMSGAVLASVQQSVCPVYCGLAATLRRRWLLIRLSVITVSSSSHWAYTSPPMPQLRHQRFRDFVRRRAWSGLSDDLSVGKFRCYAVSHSVLTDCLCNAGRKLLILHAHVRQSSWRSSLCKQWGTLCPSDWELVQSGRSDS